MNTCWALYFEHPLPYAVGWSLQQALHARRGKGEIPDIVLFLQHPPTVTLGRRGRTQHLLFDPAGYAARGIELHTASRGGDVTFHGPGQWVLYPILHLGGDAADSRSYLFNLEEIALRTCADFGVKAWRREGKNGAWTDAGKIAAIGFHIKRWITLHGMSFNVDLDPSFGFSSIVPCGLAGEPVASLRTLLGEKTPAMDRARDRLALNFSETMGRPLTVFRESDPWPEPIASLKPGH